MHMHGKSVSFAYHAGVCFHQPLMHQNISYVRKESVCFSSNWKCMDEKAWVGGSFVLFLYTTRNNGKIIFEMETSSTQPRIWWAYWRLLKSFQLTFLKLSQLVCLYGEFQLSLSFSKVVKARMSCVNTRWVCVYIKFYWFTCISLIF